MNVKLRTAKVLEAEKVEGADKLLKLQIEVVEEKRQLITVDGELPASGATVK
jgi:methionyl-tRNA synthetase